MKPTFAQANMGITIYEKLSPPRFDQRPVWARRPATLPARSLVVFSAFNLAPEAPGVTGEKTNE
jgi:hypothetical protein